MRFVSVNRPAHGDRAVRDIRTGRLYAAGLSRDASIALAVALNASAGERRRVNDRERDRTRRAWR